MENRRTNSWGALGVAMALTYVLVKWIARRLPYGVAPLTLLVKFITEKFSQEIDCWLRWVKTKLTNIWNWLARPWRPRNANGIYNTTR